VVVGSVELHPLLDAVGVLASYSETYPKVPEDEWAPYRELYPELFAPSGWRLPVVVYLLRSEGTTVLVDTGIGPPGLWTFYAPEREGLLPRELEKIGVRPESVDVVLLSHLHVDHLGWNTDEDGVVVFPNARYLVHPRALAHAWSAPDRPHIRRCVEPLLERFEDAADGDGLAPGVTVRDLPGHYPGHVGVSVRSDGARAELIADVAPHPALLDRQEWVFAFDEVEQTATRHDVVEEVVDTDCVVVCGHYPGSGIGHVLTRDSRVVWEELDS
jgi:glyoxylase-like metal-dependent hydrolase (beta-lactamase superfamily II)